MDEDIDLLERRPELIEGSQDALPWLVWCRRGLRQPYLAVALIEFDGIDERTANVDGEAQWMAGFTQLCCHLMS